MRWIVSVIATGAAAVALLLGAARMGRAATDFSAMNFMLGTWTCSGKALDGSAFHLTETTKKSADGTRFVTRDSSGKVSTELRYDEARKLWLESSVNANDGSNSSETSPGWEGDKLVFTGQVNIKGMQSLDYRSTTTKLSATRTEQVDEIQGPTGWMQFDTATCDKAR
jgi:hypothetical protein